jgi:hypothetical protein
MKETLLGQAKLSRRRRMHLLLSPRRPSLHCRASSHWASPSRRAHLVLARTRSCATPQNANQHACIHTVMPFHATLVSPYPPFAALGDFGYSLSPLSTSFLRWISMTRQSAMRHKEIAVTTVGAEDQWRARHLVVAAVTCEYEKGGVERG